MTVRNERERLVMYTVRLSVLSGHKKNHCKDAAHHGQTDKVKEGTKEGRKDSGIHIHWIPLVISTH